MIMAADKLKTCHADPAHIWMADLPYCPYCNHSRGARVHWMRGIEKAEQQDRKIKLQKER